MNASVRKYFLSLFFLALTAKAHDSTDWRLDDRAFQSAKRPLQKFVFALQRDLSSYRGLSIEPSYLREKLSQFSGLVPVVIGSREITLKERASPGGRLQAIEFLTQEYSALGFQVSRHETSSLTNFIAEKKGRDPNRVLILSAHLDSVGNAGANDDGSGIVASLAIARALAKTDFNHTLRVIAFDSEERGLLGSRAYVAALAKRSEKIIGNINLEMLGTNSRHDGAFHVIDCDRSESKPLSEHVMNSVQALHLPLQRVGACTDRSDHASFWEADIPAIVVSENFFGGDGDRCYHRRCDVVDERIDFDYMSRLANAIGTAVAQLLEASD